MSKRTISTKLAIEGESEYKQKIASVNRELKVLASESSMVAAKYRDQANSEEALAAKTQTLERQIAAESAKVAELSAALSNAQGAKAKYDAQVSEGNANLEQARAKLEALKSSTEDTAEEEAALAEEIKKQEEALAQATAGQEAAERGISEWQRQLNNANADLYNHNADLERNKEYLDEARQSTDHCASSIDQYGREVRQAGDESDTFGDKSKQAIQALSAALASAGVAKAIKEITDALWQCIEASKGFETAMAPVHRSVHGTEEQMAAVTAGIVDLSTKIPKSAEGIAEVVAASGQLGIATEDVLDFAEVMVGLGETTNMTATEAATSLARVANITSLAAEDYERLGSTILALGNSAATNEVEIVAMSTRLASAGTLAGMTQADIMALATAMSSVGIEAEAGGTAMTQTLTAMEKAVASGGDKLERFAEIAGMTSTEFADTWNTQAVSAVQRFVAGLGDLDNKGESVTMALEDLGLSGIRQSNMLRSLALASDLLAKAISTSSEAWEENTALAERTAKSYGTTDSKLTILESSVGNLKAAIGDQLTPALKEMAEAGASVADRAKKFVEENGYLVPVFTALITGATVLTGGLILYGNAAKLAAAKTAILTAVQTTFNTALAACPAVFVAAAIAALVVGIGVYKASVEAAADATDELDKKQELLYATTDGAKQKIDEATKSYDLQLKTLDSLMAKETKSAQDKAAISQICDRLSAGIGKITVAYDEESDSINYSTDALRNYIAAALQVMGAQSSLDLANARQEKLISAMGMQKEEIDKCADALKQYNQMQENGTYWARLYEDESRQVDDTLQSMTDSQMELLVMYVANEDAIAKLTKTTEAYWSGQESESASVEDICQRMNQINSAIAALQEGYDEAKKSAKDSIESQVGLFAVLSGEADKTANDIIDALDSQIDTLTDYADNIQAAMAKGINPEIIQELTSEFSEENAKYLDSLASASDYEVRLINDKYARVQTVTDTAAGAMADAQTGYTEQASRLASQWDDVVNRLYQYNETRQSGQQTVQGAIDGALSMQKPLETAYEKLGHSAAAAFNRALEIHSPSRVFIESGKQTGYGTIQGALSMQVPMEKTYEELGHSVSDAFNRGLDVGTLPRVRPGQVGDLDQTEIHAIPQSISPEPNIFDKTASQAALVAGSLITATTAAKNEEIRQADIVLNITNELDGAILSQRTYRYNEREKTIRGENMVRFNRV